jgi:hypothetical protein
MKFIKENYLIIIFAVLIIVIIGLAVKVINCNPVSIAPPNSEREYLLNRIEQDSIQLEEMRVSYIRFKEIAESKPREIIKIKYKYIHEKDSLTSIPINGKVSALARYLHNQ